MPKALSLIFVTITFFLSSCAVNNNLNNIPIEKNTFVAITKFNVANLNKDLSIDTGNHKLATIFSPSFSLANDTIKIYFYKSKIEVYFNGTYATEKKTYKARVKNGIVYTKIINKNFFIPLFYSKRDILKYRLSYTKSSELMVKQRWINEMNILLLAGGGTIKQVFLYKIL